MKRIAIALTTVSFALNGSTAATTAPAIGLSVTQSHAALDDLLAADRRFANQAASAPGVQAMAPMFAADALMMGVPEPGFAKGPAEAVARLARIIGDSAARSSLTWSTARAGVSADGLQGFTIGYLNASEPGKESHSAKYLAYWVKAEGGWQVRLYKVAGREPGPIPTTTFPPLPPGEAAAAAAAAGDDAAITLAAAEKAFSDASQAGGLRENFKKFGRGDSLHTLADNNLLLGNEAIGNAHPEGPSPLRWKADDVIVASSGDLGATYGFLERNGPTPPGRLAKIPFFTIWHRDGPTAPWRYVAE